MSHTPGPWKVVYIDGELTGSIYSKKIRICSGICDDMKLENEAEANAYLIASAPDMKDEIDRLKAEKAELLEVLEWLDLKFDRFDDGYGRAMFSRGDFKKVRAAIKKARGEE